MDFPKGFAPYTTSAFASTFGPDFESRSGAVPVLGIGAAAEHANSIGRVHGGLLSALADSALGNFVKSPITEQTLAVTVGINASFIAGARICSGSKFIRISIAGASR